MTKLFFQYAGDNYVTFYSLMPDIQEVFCIFVYYTITMRLTQFMKTVSLADEEWKPIEGFENYYISTFGRVISDKKKSPHLMVLYNRKERGKEYTSVCLCGRKRVRARVHRLVAMAFLPNPNNYTEIDHINNDGTDNRVDNLRWCTHKDNMRNPLTREKQRQYRFAHPFEKIGRYPRNVDITVFFNRHEDKMKPVVQIKDGVVIGRYKSLGEAERNGYKKTTVSAAINGRLKTYRGCVWMLLSEYEKVAASIAATSQE